MALGASIGFPIRLAHENHEHWLHEVADSYHYQVGKTYYCWAPDTVDEPRWKPCKILSVGSHYLQYFIQVKDSDGTLSEYHVTPSELQHNGKYLGYIE